MQQARCQFQSYSFKILDTHTGKSDSYLTSSSLCWRWNWAIQGYLPWSKLNFFTTLEKKNFVLVFGFSVRFVTGVWYPLIYISIMNIFASLYCIAYLRVFLIYSTTLKHWNWCHSNPVAPLFYDQGHVFEFSPFSEDKNQVR